jgi:HSP20 family protein
LTISVQVAGGNRYRAGYIHCSPQVLNGLCNRRRNSWNVTVPGMTAENVDIKMSDGTITIRGEKSEEKKEEKEDYLVSERRYGEFQRTLSLPSGVDADAVSADFANGVLTVTLPKTPEAKQKERKVEVKSAA